MKKINRLLKNEDFKKVIDKRRKLFNPSFSISYIENRLNRVRIGVSVSKKNGNAIVRNKIKRQIRMMASSIIPVNTKLDIIIIPGKEYLKLSYQENFNNLLELFNKIKGEHINEKQN